MAVIRTQPAGDLRLVNGQLIFIEGVDFTRQKIASRFRFFLGEWFLDQRQGLPYYRDVFKKKPDLGVIRSVFRDVLAKTPGVATVKRFDIVFDRVARELGFDFEVMCTSGEPLIIAPNDRAFIVSF